MKLIFTRKIDIIRILSKMSTLHFCVFSWFTISLITEDLVQFSRSVVSDSLWPHGPQHTRPPCPSPTPGVHPNSCASSWWCHAAISSSVVPFSSCPQSLPASGSLSMSQLFAWGGQSIEFQPQHQSFQWTPRTDLLYDGLVGSPCSPRESSPAPQFKSINSSALSFLRSPTLTSIHDHWENHSRD